MWAIDKAPELWKTRGRAGSSCATCHNDPKDAFKTWAASMPQWEPRLDKVLGVEEFITRHAKATTGVDWLMETDDEPRNVGLSAQSRQRRPDQGRHHAARQSKAAIERGKALADRKLGELNFACTDCHGKSANHWIRGAMAGRPKGQYDHFPTWRTSLLAIWDIRKRFQWCQVNIRADELPPDAKEYGDLELYLASLNDGLKLSVPGITALSPIAHDHPPRNPPGRRRRRGADCGRLQVALYPRAWRSSGSAEAEAARSSTRSATSRCCTSPTSTAS